MKKWKIAVGVIVLVCIVGVAAVILAPNDWENVTGTESFFYGDENNGVWGSDISDAYDHNRYKQFKLQADVAMSSGSCTLRLRDKENNVIKEWGPDCKSIEEEWDKETMERIVMIEIEPDGEDAVGKCSVMIYGKKNLLTKIKYLLPF